MTSPVTHPILAPITSSRKAGLGRATYPSRRLGEDAQLPSSIRQPTNPTPAAGNGASNGQSSRFRGVSLLRRTGRWHAQINFDGRQIHLGFFTGEDEAAGAYDRAAIIKWAASARSPTSSPPSAGRPPLPPPTNFHISRYAAELKTLGNIKPTQLVAALSEERTRRGAMAALAKGFPQNSGGGGGSSSTSADDDLHDTESLAASSAASIPSTPSTPLKHSARTHVVEVEPPMPAPQQRIKRRKVVVPNVSACM